MAAPNLPPVDFVKYFDKQIAAKEKEIEETRKFEEDARDYIGNDQVGTSRAVPMERELEGLRAGRQRFVDANELRDAMEEAQQGHPLALAGKIAEYPPLGLLMGEGVGLLFGRLGGLARGMGRQGGRAAAEDAAAAKPGTAPSPVEQCPIPAPANPAPTLPVRSVAPSVKPGYKRVGRWMSPEEYRQMSTTGRVQEGAGGHTLNHPLIPRQQTSC